MEQAAQWGGWCLIPENLEGQVEWDSKQPDLIADVPAYCKGGWTKVLLKVPSNPNYAMIFF